MLSEAEKRAKEKNLEFTITVKNIVVPTICPVLGIPIIPYNEAKEKGDRTNSPSLDRIDNSK